MTYTTFNRKAVDTLTQPMFMGESVNVSRYDIQKINALEKLIEKTLGFFWRPEEIDVSKDRVDWQNLSDSEKHIFISNLKYQTLLDSMAARSVNLMFLPICSLPELETWVETWAFSECLAEGTEVLTTNGWKDLGGTTVEDDCLVYNLDDGSVFFEKPKRVVEYDLDTDMVHYKASNTKQFNQLVTPNHRMPVIHCDIKKDGSKKRYFKEAKDQDYAAHHDAPISGLLVGGTVSKLSSMDRMFIAVQADGSVSKRYNGKRVGTIPVWFDLTKERKITRLLKLAEDCNIKPVILTPGNNGRSKRIKINIPVEFVTSDIKTFSWVDLSTVTKTWCEEFLEELSHWDSHIIKETFTYSTVSEYNAGVVQAIAALCGKSPRMAITVDERKESFQPVFSINVINSDRKNGQSINKEYVKYKGKVRCLETSTGAFLIRYKGVVSVSGNTIHSRSYTHILRNLFTNPGEVFDDIVINPAIVKRAESIAVHFDKLIMLTSLYNTVGEGTHKVDGKNVVCTLRKVKEALYLAVCATNALESIRFYVSFACSFAFAERKLLEGNAKIIKLVARDEALHKAGTHIILSRWANGNDDPEMQEISRELAPLGKKIFLDVVTEEKDWAHYLFQDGSMIGLNAAILNEYLEYVADRQLTSLGHESPFTTNGNPLPWMSNYLTSDAIQPAPQETELSSYLTSATDPVVEDGSFDEFDL